MKSARTQHADDPLFDAVIRIDRLPAQGRDLDILADASQLEALAGLMKVTSISMLEVHLLARPIDGGLHVTGRLRAQITQPCIITFEPVSQTIDELIDRVFVPEPPSSKPMASNAEVFIDLQADDFPDYIKGPEVDLYNLVIDTLGLAIEPYPRAQGASIEALEIDRDDENTSPFASLKSLIDPGGKP